MIFFIFIQILIKRFVSKYPTRRYDASDLAFAHFIFSQERNNKLGVPDHKERDESVVDC